MVYKVNLSSFKLTIFDSGNEQFVGERVGLLHDAERKRSSSAGRREARRYSAAAIAGCAYSHC